MNIPVINTIEEHTTLDNKIIESNNEALIQMINNNNNIQTSIKNPIKLIKIKIN